MAQRSRRDPAGPRVAGRRRAARGRRRATPRRSGRRWSRSAPSAWIATRGSAPSSCAWCRGRWAPPSRARRTWAAPPCASPPSRWPIGCPRPTRELVAGDDSVSVALLEPGRGWSVTGMRDDPRAGRAAAAARWRSSTPKRSIGSPSSRPVGGRPGLVLLPADAPGVAVTSQPALRLDGADERGRARRRRRARRGRRRGSGGRRAAAAADAHRRAAGRRRGRRGGRTAPGGCAHATRASGASSAGRSAATRRCATSWRTCTCARRACGRPSSTRPPPSTTTSTRRAGRPRWRRRTSRARRARSRTARCRSSAASPSPQEHPAHRFLRRIVVREQQFGDAAHHERELGRALAADAAGRQQRTTGNSAAPVSVH